MGVKLILTISGLPGSGKTVFSLDWLGEDPNHRFRVNYDELRLKMFGEDWKFNRKQEALMKAEALKLATEAANQGRDIIVDNTNLTTGARAPWEALAKQLDVNYEQHEIDTPIAECIERDHKREGRARVGRAVIERLALFHGFIDWASYDLTRPKDFVICDVDGTLSDPTHRLHYVKKDEQVSGWKPRWDKFHAEVDEDGLHEDIRDLLLDLSQCGCYILVVSGRSPDYGCGKATEDWLDKNGVPYRHLFMRSSGDTRPDFVHKQEILDLLPKDRIAFVIDDRQQVVDMWRKNGLRCLQVAKGDF